MTLDIRPRVSGMTTVHLYAELRNLHPELPIEVDDTGHHYISGVTASSWGVRKGDIFAALPGTHTHGSRFAVDAVKAGAQCIFSDAEGVENAKKLLKDARIHRMPAFLTAENPGELLGDIAALMYGKPADCLRSFAVTGTNGKTTTTYILDDLLRKLGRVTGLIGTVEVRLAGDAIPAQLTTPMPADLQAMLAILREKGGTDVAMEVSSHALSQGRTKPVCFTVAGFTNLTQDHLDFHKTMEEYYEAKKVLFTPECSRRCVVCVDDAWGQRLASETEASVPLAVFSRLEGEGWQVEDIQVGTPTRFMLRHTDGRELPVASFLPADFNISNVALACVMLVESGVSIEDMRAVIGEGIDAHVPGRMEIVGRCPRVVVDFAHNAAALESALKALRPTTAGKLIVVTGSAGERDVDKRPEMGRVVARFADRVYITDDDPHMEDPAPIRAALLEGALSVGGGGTTTEVALRQDAIREAILDAGEQDTVLLAGRGHEEFMPTAAGDIPFDDRVEARKAIAEREAGVKHVEGAEHVEGTENAEGAGSAQGEQSAQGAGNAGQKGNAL